MQQTNYNWQKEVNDTIVQSLVTSFGLDFLLLKDKKGGMLIRCIMSEMIFGQPRKKKSLSGSW